MTSNNDDLINRSTLKESIRKRLGISSLKYLTEQEKVIVDEIDNASPVVNEYTKGFSDGERSGRNFPLTDEEKAIIVSQWRPHGEWIRGREICREMIGNYTEHIEYKDFTCSVCGIVLDRLLYHCDGSPFYKFCPNCGADMRGGRE